ncbi:hypothetical protein GCM10023185_26380 [Hymenobacter saemangeumensis]|uniref:LVIVD repeat-containing protein n=1 Tax=Hymenobacter saemangeumensis TaxID=1084522 RepID=A0ABP8IIK1_9BACT
MKTLYFLRLAVLFGLGLTLSSGGCGDSSSASPSVMNSASPGGGGDGQAGSTARFAILGSTLYAVDDTSLRTFDLSTPEAPVAGPVVNVGMGVETIFPQAPYLFIGSQMGMFIYSVAGSTPQRIGAYQHVASCDPVVVDGRYAYVTLREGTNCTRGVNQMDVVDLANLSQPRLARSYPLTRPHGLGTDSSLVFVCDGGNAIKVFDATNTPTLRQVRSFDVAATDVIARQGVLLVTGSDGLYQYRYRAAANGGSLQQLSRIPVTPRQ